MSTDDLIAASSRGDLPAVKALLAQGGDVNATTKTKLLFRGVGNKGATPLIVASSSVHIEVVLALLDKDANVNAATNKGATALMLAAARGSVEVTRALLDKGAEVDGKDNDGWTALIVASSNGHTEGVRVLLDKGANVNAETVKGTTALMLASLGGHIEVVQVLLDKGANVNANTKHGLTALMRAAEGGNIRVVRTLLGKRAEINSQDFEGRTALMKSSWEGHVNVVQALIDEGADLSIRDNQGNTALMRVKDTFLSKPKLAEEALKQGARRQAALNVEESNASSGHTDKFWDETVETKSTKKSGQRTFNLRGFFFWVALMVFIAFRGTELLQRTNVSGGGYGGDATAWILLIVGIPVSFFFCSFKKREW